MFAKLFTESGLSLDRLKSLLEVAAAGSMVKAAGGDPVKQSQYSRQIKELENFFRAKLIERQGKGTRLTSNGKELARISRFFMLGLSNFQRGCLNEEQTFRIGASATFIRQYLLPVLSQPRVLEGTCRYAAEVASDDEIERRLHDLTLDFGITTSTGISRPLQLKDLGKWRLKLWVPRALHITAATAQQAFKERALPLILVSKEIDWADVGAVRDYPAHLVCDDFAQALAAMNEHGAGAVLPDFLSPSPREFLHVPIASLESNSYHFHLAWNPRLLRLNPPATRRRDFLAASLAKKMIR